MSTSDWQENLLALIQAVTPFHDCYASCMVGQDNTAIHYMLFCGAYRFRGSLRELAEVIAASEQGNASDLARRLADAKLLDLHSL